MAVPTVRTLPVEESTSWYAHYQDLDVALKWMLLYALGYCSRWNPIAGAYEPARPADAPFGWLFISTNDAAAAAPPSTNLKVGDRWARHPDAG